MPTEPDYYIVTIDTEQGPMPWRWELRRRSSPMGLGIGCSGYQSQASAEYAGERELEDFRRRYPAERDRHLDLEADREDSAL
jgi:hypothetical protein